MVQPGPEIKTRTRSRDSDPKPKPVLESRARNLDPKLRTQPRRGHTVLSATTFSYRERATKTEPNAGAQPGEKEEEGGWGMRRGHRVRGNPPFYHEYLFFILFPPVETRVRANEVTSQPREEYTVLSATRFS